ncbi:KEOPS complex subunit Cgi121 [Methanohalophilus sp.]|uniref:KEOPS complex subunit Cgi121 n=1 Tax=Methanohalophilus sp. TaxID=1966352 RepID=UPI00262AF8FA|nr:KEOPS complex subunit Cgi121 [Methanohalophilus sp.]MDK2893139.1 hypothetical protein [Methanohalophilus sp.]
MKREIVEGIVFVDDLQEFLNEIHSLATSNEVIIQAMDASKLVGMSHIDLAMRKAMRAFEEQQNVARDLGVEIMRYASGKRQIGEAFSLGLSEGENHVVFVVLGELEEAVSRTSGMLRELIEISPVLEFRPDKKAILMEHFGIQEAEIIAVGYEKLPDLVLERVALVDVLK